MKCKPAQGVSDSFFPLWIKIIQEHLATLSMCSILSFSFACRSYLSCASRDIVMRIICTRKFSRMAAKKIHCISIIIRYMLLTFIHTRFTKHLLVFMLFAKASIHLKFSGLVTSSFLTPRLMKNQHMIHSIFGLLCFRAWRATQIALIIE